MSNLTSKPSNKVHIIDRSTFENLQQSSGSSGTLTVQKKPIRNAKYKKTSKVSFNLLDFLTQRPKQSSSERRRCATKAIYAVKTNPFKKRRGKQREGGRKKHYSRLKKSILRYRQQQRTQKQTLEDVTLQMCDLQLNSATITEEAQMQKANEDSLVRNAIHSRRFRDYCDNCTTSLISSLTQSLLRDLNRFQRRAYALNEIKARAHRRFVLGFREVQNFMLIDKIKILFIATDLEVCDGEDGLDATIAKLKTQCQIKEIPYIFSLTRREIAYALYKKVPISCVGVLDYDGARDMVAQLKEELEQARVNYQKLLQIKQRNLQTHNNTNDLLEKNVL